jgi:branched-chain amino acid transport system ATP-binding protein
MSSGLELTKVSIDRSGTTIVRDVSLSCPRGEVTVLLGANGAGKSTLLDGVAGVIPLRTGNAFVDGVDVAGSPRGRRRGGVAYVEQGRTIFADLSVLDNLRAVSTDPTTIDRALTLFPELRPRLATEAGLLSGGEQQMVVLARAICTNPDIVLIDEMSQGLAPIVVQRLLPILRMLADNGAAVLLVEQFANLALRIGDRAYVMYVGEVSLEADCTQLLAEPSLLRDAYLHGR